MKRSKNYLIFIGLSLLFLLINSFNTILDISVDYQWFKELGYLNSYLTRMVTKLKIGIPGFLIFFAIIYIYMMSIKKRYYKDWEIESSKKEEKKINLSFKIISGLLSLFFTMIYSNNLWFSILQFFNRSHFELKDPIFARDISFYFFTLPLVKEALGLILLFVALMAIITIITNMALFVFRRPSKFVYTSNNVFDIKGDNLGKNIKDIFNQNIIKSSFSQIGIFGAFILVIIGINYFLSVFEVLYSARGVVYGAGFTDVKFGIWIYRLMGLVSLISAFGFWHNIKKNKIKKALIGPIALVAISLIGNMGIGLVQKFIVEPDEISKENQFIEYNIEYTQKAFGLNDVEHKEFPVTQDISKEDLVVNEETVGNIRINDYRPITQVYNQLQAMRLYYTFNSVDVCRYNIDGKETQVFLSARELDQNNLQTQTWINKHLKYTHGYGVAMSPVNAVTSNGQPELLIKNIPTENHKDLEISRPEIYFGEATDDYIIINTDEMEFDYPEGSENKETMYEGSAGIEMKALNKLLFALKEKSFKILISNNVNSDSRMIINRNINERIRKIAPFIDYDDDPYMVLNQENGRLYWIIEGYTHSNKYPYSTPYSQSNGLNYIRNSVKVVVDAYNGTVDYYIFDEEDPIIRTYSKIFPDLFKDKSEMPAGLLSHTRYPNSLFDIQAQMYKTYHVNNPMVFYNNEDLWDISQEKYMQAIQPVEPIYQMFKLPEEAKTEFLLTIPYSPKSKQNLTSLLVARNDGENYGKLFIYEFPKGKTINGPMMIESRIDQNTDISEQLTLWSQEGSRVLRGNVIIVPIENSLLYVEPIYLQSDNENSLPEMKRVIVSIGEKMVMERTLGEALENIFGVIEEKPDIVETPTNGVPVFEEDLNELVEKSNEVFLKAKEASQNGNWGEYGSYIDELEELLNKLNEILISE